MGLKAVFLTFYLLGIIDASYAQDSKLAGTWRIIDEPARLITCSAEYDWISVDETSTSVGEFLKTHSNPFDKSSEKWTRQQILKALQSEGDESIGRFIELNYYDGCNHNATTYVRKVDGSLEMLPAYGATTAMACPHQFGGNPSGDPKYDQEKDPT